MWIKIQITGVFCFFFFKSINILSKHFKMLQRQTHKHHRIMKILFIKKKFFRFKGHQECFPLTFILFYLLHVGFFFKTIYGLRRKIMPSEFKVLPRTVYQCFILCTQSINAFFFSWSTTFRNSSFKDRICCNEIYFFLFGNIFINSCSWSVVLLHLEC